MAYTGIPITPGSGRTVHTDVITLNGTTGSAQAVKIVDATNGGTNKLTISAGGAAKVDGSAVTQPVSGTVGVTQGGAFRMSGVTTVTSITNPVAVTKSGTWGMTVTGPVAVTKSGTWGMTVTGGPFAVTKSGTWGLTVTGTVSAAKSGTWGMTVSGTVAATKSGTWGMTVSGTVAATKSGTWGLTVTGTVASTKSGTWSTTVTQSSAANLNMTEASASAIKTAVELIDDGVYTDDTSTHATGTSKGYLMMAAAVPTDAAVNANDIGAVSMSLNRELLVGPVGPNYIASAAQTQTNLDGLAGSATHVAGWESGAIDNTSNRYKDYRINVVLRTEGSSVTAGECRMYLVAELEDASWPDVFDGTESAETVTDTEERDAICRLAATSANDTSTAANVYLMCPSVAAVFNGTVPRKFVIFITQNTGTTLETTGDPNLVYVAGVS